MWGGDRDPGLARMEEYCSLNWDIGFTMAHRFAFSFCCVSCFFFFLIPEMFSQHILDYVENCQ